MALGSRALDLLALLLERAGETLSKDELIASVWPGLHVTDVSLRVHIAAIRKALGEGAGARFISNVPGRGYAFVAPVTTEQAARASPEQARPDGPPRAAFHELPLSLTRIFGREEILRRLAEQQSHRRLVTLVGPGGIGKTTVAVAVARAIAGQYNDGVLFLDLAPIADPSFVPHALASALGIALQMDDPIGSLVAALRGKRMLLVMDSCERVVEQGASLAAALLRRLDGLNILATSREALRAEGEWVHRLPPLPSPQHLPEAGSAEALRFPAVQLFVERASEGQDDYRLTDGDAPYVAQICSRLDGIPLAIELAAGRMDSIGARALAEQLDDRFRVLTRGRRTALPRHQTMLATLDWSFALLSAPEQTLMLRLAVFQARFSLAAAGHLCGDDPLPAADMQDALSDLAAKSLLVAEVGGAEVHYRMLDTMRAYGATKLAESGEGATYARRHARWMRQVFETAAREWEEQPSDVWLVRYAPQIDDLRSALGWAFSENGDAELGVGITISAVPLWAELSIVDECLGWVERALAASSVLPVQSQRWQMQLHAALGGLQMYATNRMQQASGAWSEALRIAENIGDEDYQLRAIRALWAGSINQGEFLRALDYAERFRDLIADTDARADQHVAERMVGTAQHFLGHQVAAEANIDRMLAGYVAPAQRSHTVRYLFDQRASARIIRARLLWLKGRPDAALAEAAETIAYGLSIDHTLTLCNVLTQAACPLTLAVGDISQAEQYVALLRQRTEAMALDVWRTYAVCFDCDLMIRRGDLATGLVSLRKAVAALRRTGFGHYLTSFLMIVAQGECRANQHAAAAAALAEALRNCTRTGEAWNLPELHRLRGELALAVGTAEASVLARKDFTHALDIARQQGALAWELRAATSMARLLQTQQQGRDATDLLERVVDRFTEGFDRPDLAEASALLNALRRPDNA